MPNSQHPLLLAHPVLARAVATEPLCDLPTPSEKLDALGSKLGITSLYVKHDGRSALPYGGNKTRKLEFLLAEARRQGRKEILTFGYAGSNFALATALYAQQLDMRCIAMLLPQKNARYVQQNLLLGHDAGAELHTAGNTFMLGLRSLWQSLRHGIMQSRMPYWIPAGGSHPLGVLGFINAAYELRAQIDAGQLPMPEVIYLPLGSMGSAAGLDIGFRALGLSTKIIAVRVVPTEFGSTARLARLTSRTLNFIRKLDPDFGQGMSTQTLCEVRDEFFGEAYGAQTDASREAIRLAGDLGGLKLDGTYAAKAMAALINDARTGRLRDKNVLFWHTGNSRDLSDRADGLDHKLLPSAFHRYFEQPLQD